MVKKPLSPTAACAVKCMHAAMQYLNSLEGGAPVKEISKYIEEYVELTDWEKERAGKMMSIRWQTNYQFYSTNYVKAGFIEKSNGLWYLTRKGEEALSRDPEEVFVEAHKAYSEWAKKQKTDKPEVESKDVVPDIVPLDIENLKSQALSDIKEYIQAMDPIEFQHVVAALLRAMGYYTPFVAPKGKDGGVDVIAYSDPLGLKTPIIKVQVKRYTDASNVPVSEVRSLLGAINQSAGEVALFVTTSDYSKDTKAEMQGKCIRLINGNEFINLWIEFYPKMSDEDKDRLPLKYVAFLDKHD